MAETSKKTCKFCRAVEYLCLVGALIRCLSTLVVFSARSPSHRLLNYSRCCSHICNYGLTFHDIVVCVIRSRFVVRTKFSPFVAVKDRYLGTSFSSRAVWNGHFLPSTKTPAMWQWPCISRFSRCMVVLEEWYLERLKIGRWFLRTCVVVHHPLTANGGNLTYLFTSRRKAFRQQLIS